MIRGRRSIAARVFEDLRDLEGVEGHYLVMYDFAQKAGKTTVPGFFRNLNRILALGDGRRVQKSVIECRRLRTARAIEAICLHYRARDIDIYEVIGKLERVRARAPEGRD